MKLGVTTGRWASQAWDFHLCIKSQNMFLISWAEQKRVQREPERALKTNSAPSTECKASLLFLSVIPTNSPCLPRSRPAPEHISQILLWFANSPCDERNRQHTSLRLLLSASKLTAWPWFLSLETGVVKNSCPLPTLHFWRGLALRQN